MDFFATASISDGDYKNKAVTLELNANWQCSVMEEVLKICRKQSLMLKYKILTTLKHKSFRPKCKNIKIPNCAENHSETLEKK